MQLIVVNGFSYSGSSAVVDFLLDHKHVAAFPGGEFRMCRAKWGLNRLFRRTRKKRISAQLADEFAAFCRGKMPVTNGPDERANKNIRRMRRYFGSFFDTQVDIFLKSLRAKPTRSEFLAAAQSFIDALVREVARRENADVVVMDQGFRPATIHYRRMFPSYTVVCIVRRDVRDQITDLLRHNYTPTMQFASDLDRRLTKCKTQIKLMSDIKPKIHWLQFERFVTNSKSRSKLRELLGLTPKYPWFLSWLYARFQPMKSRRNIGIYTEGAKWIAELALTHPHLIYPKSTK
jgi:hypothetical protein